MGVLKAFIVVLSIACLLASIPAGVSARMEARWALQVGDILTGNDISIQHPMADLYHSSDTSLTDSEAASITFPSAIDLSPAQDTNIALPHISQHVNQSASASDTGYFDANWCYLNVPNHGGGPIVASDPTLAHPFGSSAMLGSEFLFPYMTPIKDTKVNFKPIINNSDKATAISGDSIIDSAPTSFTIKNAIMVPVTQNASNMDNQTAGQTVNQTGPTLPHGAFQPRINPASTKDQIQSMTDLQRMYRNAFVGTTMYMAYRGTVQSPTWISPNVHPGDVTKMKDHFQTNMDALNMTKAGTYLVPVFWSL